MRILVLGIGNILLGDEGIGVHVVRSLLAGYHLPATVTVLDGGTAGMTLLDDVAAAEHLIVVDCARLEAPPGTIRLVEGAAVPAFFQSRLSPHQIGLADLLAAAALLDATPAGLTLVAIQPACLDLGLELSPEGMLAAAAATDLLVERLAALGAVVARHPARAA